MMIRGGEAVRLDVPRDFEHNRLVGRRCVVDALHGRPPGRSCLALPHGACGCNEYGVAVGQRMDEHRPKPPDEADRDSQDHNRHDGNSDRQRSTDPADLIRLAAAIDVASAMYRTVRDSQRRSRGDRVAVELAPFGALQ